MILLLIIQLNESFKQRDLNEPLVRYKKSDKAELISILEKSSSNITHKLLT